MSMLKENPVILSLLVLAPDIGYVSPRTSYTRHPKTLVSAQNKASFNKVSPFS